MGVKVRHDRGAWWVLVHHRGNRWKKRVGADKSAALEVARGMQRRLAAGEFDAGKPQPEAPVPFSEFAARWLRTEVELPIERELGDRLAPGTAEVYRMQVDVHLGPWFRERDVRSIGAADVQG